MRSFPQEVRRKLGQVIFDLQKGRKLSKPMSRPMPSVGTGVEELRVKDRTGAYRAFYYARLSDAVLIFHAFEKKTAKTPPHEIDVARRRLKEML